MITNQTDRDKVVAMTSTSRNYVAYFNPTLTVEFRADDIDTDHEGKMVLATDGGIRTFIAPLHSLICIELSKSQESDKNVKTEERPTISFSDMDPEEVLKRLGEWASKAGFGKGFRTS